MAVGDLILDTDLHRRRRGRNYALAGFLLGLVALFFVITLVKMSGATG
jgi:hypothetical protein